MLIRNPVPLREAVGIALGGLDAGEQVEGRFAGLERQARRPRLDGPRRRSAEQRRLSQ